MDPSDTPFKLVIERALREAIQEVKRPKAYRSHARKFLAAFGELAVEEVTPRVIEDWKHERLRQVKPATVTHELSFLSRCFRVALRDELIDRNPLWLVRKPGKSPIFRKTLSDEEELLLLAEATEQEAQVIRFALITGLRRIELFGARGEDWQGDWLWVQEGKTGTRWIPLSPEAQEILGKVVSSPREYLFYPWHPATDRYYTGQHFMTEALAPMRKRAGVAHASFRVFRRTFATRLANAGVELLHITRILGHSDPNMTMRYAHVKNDNLLTSVSCLEKPPANPEDPNGSPR